MINWISSYPKSGNTWVRALLTAYFNDGYVDINNLWGIGDTKRYFYHKVSPKASISLEESVLLRPAALLNLIECEKQKPLLVKTHHANVLLQDIPLIPKTLTKQAFYLVRDPRDVAISYSNHMGTTIDKAIDSMSDDGNAIGEDIFHYLSTWSEHVKSWMAPDFPVDVIKYETLKEYPAQTLAHILKKLGIPVNQKRIKKAVEVAKFSRLKAQEEKKGFKEAQAGKFFKSGKSTWKEVLTQSQQDRIVSDHGEIMTKLGYA